MPVTVVTDSASSIQQADLDRLGILVVPLWITFDDEPVPETDVDLTSLYDRLGRLNTLPKTSQPSPGRFVEVFLEAVAAGNDVVVVLISSKLSGTYASAEVAAQMVRRESPSANILLVDSESNSLQQGFAVVSAAECALAGGDADACAAAARYSIARSRFLFAPDGLDHLARGGRIGGATAFLGHVLKIAPILTASEGATAVAGVARSHKRALRRITAMLRADVERCGLSRAVVQAVGGLDEARAWAHEVVEPLVGMPVPVVPIPVSVGIHVGPAVGIAYETESPLR